MRSVFDTLERDCSGKKGEERTAIELAVIRESMSRLGSEIRWNPHPRMVVDGMTKIPKYIGPSNLQLLHFMKHGRFKLTDESSEMRLRQSDPSLKSRSKEAMERAIRDPDDE